MIIKIKEQHIEALKSLFAIVHSEVIQGTIAPVAIKIIEDIKTMLIIPTIEEAEKSLEELKKHLEKSNEATQNTPASTKEAPVSTAKKTK